MHIEGYHADRSALLPLFELADDSPVQIRSYISLGEVLVARDGDAIIGHLQLIETDRKSTRLNSSHIQKSRMPSSA